MHSILKLKLMTVSLLFLTLAACGSGDGILQLLPETTDNKTPVALDQTAKTTNNTAINITLSGNDAEGDALTYSITANPQAGTLSGIAPHLIYTPDANFVGDDRFSFIVNDGVLTSKAATIVISVAFITDDSPNTFTFAHRPEVPASVVVVSNVVPISGINTPVKVEIVNGEYSIDGAAFTALAGVITDQQSIRIQLTASAIPSETTEARVTIGGVTGVFKVTTSGDTLNPTARIIFPPTRALTTEDRILVRGSAADNGRVVAVTVNGIAVTSGDNFLNWSAIVPLKPGMNQITVAARDRGGNSNNEAATVTVESRPLFLNKTHIAYHNASARLMFFDRGAKGLYAFDASAQRYHTISDQNKPQGGRNLIGNFKDLDLDETTNAIYTIDTRGSSRSVDRLMQVDINTGQRTVITQDSQSVAPHTLIKPRLIEIDSALNIAYVYDASLGGGYQGRQAILRFDLTTGAASVLSDNSFAGPRLTWPDYMVLDKTHNRLLLSDTFGNNRVYAIDLETGIRSHLIDSNAAITLPEPKGVAIDNKKQRALVYDSKARIDGQNVSGIFAIDLTTGELSSVVEDLQLRVGVFTSMDMVYDDNNGQDRIFIVTAGVVHQIDLKTGAESIFSSNTIPNDSNPLNTATGLTIDPAKNRLLVTTSNTAQIIAIDLASGERSIISDNMDTPNNINPLDTPVDIAISGDQAYVIDSGNLSLIRINLADGVRSILSDNNMSDKNNTFNRLTTLAADTANARTLVVDSGRSALLSVDHDSGERDVISGNRSPDSNNPIGNTPDLIIEGGRGLMLDTTTNSILSIDLEDGTRTVFSEPGLSFPAKMVLETTRNRLLVTDTWGVKTVSLADGSVGLLSGQNMPVDNPKFDRLTDITLDVENNQALVLDPTFQRIFAVNLDSGERTYYAGGFPNGSPALYQPSRVAFDRENNQVFVATGKYWQNKGVKKINLLTGAQEAIPTSLISSASDLVFANNNQLYILASRNLSVLNTSTGSVKTVADTQLPEGENPALTKMRVMALDTANNLAYVFDENERAIFSIHLTTGERQIISGNRFPDNGSGPELLSNDISSLVFDSSKNRLLILSRRVGIIAVDINSGMRSAFSTKDMPNTLNRLNSPSGMVLDAQGERLLVFVSAGYLNGQLVTKLVAVDLTTGERTKLPGDGNSDRTNFLTTRATVNIRDISLISSDIALAIDEKNGVVLIDVATGEQVILAQ